MTTKINDEILNAYIDGELDEQQSRELQAMLFADPLLLARVNELQNTKSLFRNTFGNPPDALNNPGTNRGRSKNKGRLIGQSLAAGVIVILSFALGWQMNSDSRNSGSPHLQRSTLSILEQMVATPAADTANSTIKAVVRVSDADHANAAAMLKKLNDILDRARNNNRNLRVELVAHAKGLDLLRRDTSSVAGEIRQLLSRHNNIVIAACNKTMERLRLETGIQAELLPDVTVVPSALDQILQRLQDDWTYIQI